MTDRNVDELFNEEVIADGFFHFHSLKRGISALQETVRLKRSIVALITNRHHRHAVSAINSLHRYAEIKRHEKANKLVADGMARARAFLNTIYTWRRVTMLSRKINTTRIRRAITAWRLFRSVAIQLLLFQRASQKRSLHRFTTIWSTQSRIIKQQRATVIYHLLSLRRVVLKRALRRWLKYTLQAHVVSSAIYLTHTRTAERFVLLLRRQTLATKLTHKESLRVIAATSLRLIRRWRVQNKQTRTRSLLNIFRLRHILFQWRMSTKLHIQMVAKAAIAAIEKTAKAAHFMKLTRAFESFVTKRRCRETLFSWNEKIKILKQRRFQKISDTLILWRCHAVQRRSRRVASSVLSATIARHIMERAIKRIYIAARRSFINQCCLLEISTKALPALLHIRSRLNIWRKWAHSRRLAGRLLLDKIDGNSVTSSSYCITNQCGPLLLTTSSPHDDDDGDFDDPYAHVANELDRACGLSQTKT